MRAAVPREKIRKEDVRMRGSLTSSFDPDCGMVGARATEALSVPKTRRAPFGRTAATSQIILLVVLSDAGRRVPEMRLPCPGLADAPSAGSVRPSIRKAAFSSHD